MSQQLINQYLNEIDRLRKFSGSVTEGVISEAFKDLLKTWSRQLNWQFAAQYEFASSQKSRIRPDGTIFHSLGLPFGYWEAKDTADDLDVEIRKKLAKGYPQDNIIFENSQVAVLIQDRGEVFRCSMTDNDALLKLLNLFFGYERAEIREFRKAVEEFKTYLPFVLDALRTRIEAAYTENPVFRAAARKFLDHCRDTINPTLGEADVREMLIQHILTEEIFANIFNEGDFHHENNIARELYALEGKFFTGAVKKETLKGLELYYAAIKANAAQITSHSEKQTFLKVIYENFYKVYDTKKADRLGVVYTPNEIVRFMIEGADWLCEKHFGKNLIDEHVEILDPATGTGTFICELLEYFRGDPRKLAQKYKNELHANEVAILPYYVANLNIEATYAAISGQFAEFSNLCFVDTLDNVAGLGIRSGHQHDMFAALSDENVERVKRQNARKISVIIGNPPYNAWQENFNMRNPNRAYKRIDERIRDTYISKGTAQNQSSVYDMYTRFFRWASDRLHDDGVIALITGRKPFAKMSYDGFRRTVAAEFSEIYVVDLGGDVIANPKLSGNKHNVFGIKTGVAITFLVKRRALKTCKIFYARRPEFETAQDKLSFLSNTRASAIQFDRIEPDRNANWLDHAENVWDDFMPMVSKGAKSNKTGSKNQAIFRLFSTGLKSQRDEWVYDLDPKHLSNKVSYFCDVYEATRQNADFGARDSIKWDRELEKYLGAGVPKNFDEKAIRVALFRPFNKRYVYFDRHFNGMTYQLPYMFSDRASNPSIVWSDIGYRADFMATASEVLPDLHCGASVDAYKVVSLYRHSPDGERVDNITDWALKQFHNHYGKAQKLTALNLKHELPRIPFYPDFPKWADWGRKLMELHIGYETVEPWPLTRTDKPDEKARAAGVPVKAMLKADKVNGIIHLDSETMLSGIPKGAWTYKLGNRSGLEWILDQYKEKTPKDPTVREKFNTYRFADYKEKVIDLLARVTRVSMETLAVTGAMASTRRNEIAEVDVA
ncbi:putative helicase [Sinorhizobium kostiense]|uniref:site-specific DNA-methyltransferase (adenine-specific) n=1 Tax=Sinorhizobium kostiense TaxID=76747 RepID=A0ABS4R7T4_9HYPH|nr:type ISP restriction/modification enzyme [Sinorhizobium kostiense]MBP2238774.1 putative helicase [Sinorhizobium kostiense]